MVKKAYTVRYMIPTVMRVSADSEEEAGDFAKKVINFTSERSPEFTAPFILSVEETKDEKQKS